MQAHRLTLAALLAFTPTLALAQSPTEPTPAQLAQRDVQRYTSVLVLTSTQQEEALTIFTTAETSEAPIRSAERLARQTLLTAIEAGNTANISTVSTLLGQLSGQSTLAQSTANAALYSLLTSDQQTKFAQLLASPHGGPGGPGGPRP